jgi:hypothetical protein
VELTARFLKMPKKSDHRKLTAEEIATLELALELARKAHSAPIEGLRVAGNAFSRLSDTEKEILFLLTAGTLARVDTKTEATVNFDL